MHDRLTLAEFVRWLEKPVTPEDLLEDLSPPKHFDGARFTNYETDSRYPSQREVVGELKNFVQSHATKSILSRLRRRKSGRGLYLDGGFGVGKTHLLASVFHAHHGRKSFLSFQELMFLVGLQRLDATVSTFARNSLLVIDEFELDDPANTRIATNLLGQLLDAGVNVLTSSNTPPGSIGEGKFSVEAFRRELGQLFDRFSSLKLDGEDYRKAHHRASVGNMWRPDVTDSASNPGIRLTAPFDQLLSTLAMAHPIRIRRTLPRIAHLHIDRVEPISDPHAALRFVYLIDKVYDDNVSLSASSAISIDDLFAPSIFTGGDTKKYLRCISRLVELTS